MSAAEALAPAKQAIKQQAFYMKKARNPRRYTSDTRPSSTAHRPRLPPASARRRRAARSCDRPRRAPTPRRRSTSATSALPSTMPRR